METGDRLSLVLGVAGPAGGGKSTIVRALHEAVPESTTLFFDSYPVQMPPDLPRWLADGADFNQWKAPALVSALGEAVTAASIVLFEAPLGRRHEATGSGIDYLVFLDLPLELALARLAGREVERGPEGHAMLSGYLGLYEVVLRDVYVAQRDQVMPEADLVVDGRLSVEEIVLLIRRSAGV